MFQFQTGAIKSGDDYILEGVVTVSIPNWFD